MKPRGRVLRGLVFVAVLALLGTPAAAQTGQSFGELVGKVTDEQGAILPGVTVTLSGPAVMGVQSAQTNELGQYRFPAVASGTYTLKFELSGFSPLVRDGIVVPVRQTVTVDAQMKLAALQETVVVSGESPTVDVENTKVGARLDHETLTSVPTSRTMFGATTVLPGMVMARQDPGGLNAATSTGMVAHGNSNYNLNYEGVPADTPKNYGSMYCMDFGSAEEISVDTAAMGAEVGGGGGANINVVPKSGGNNVKGEALFSATGRGYSNAFSSSNVTSDLRAQGVTDPSLQKLTDFNANAGGPFVKDRLWWFGSFRNYTTHENVPGFPIDFLSNLRNYTASVAYQINDTRLRYTSAADGSNLQPSEIWAYNTPLTQRTRMRNFAAFVQDRLSYPRFTFNVGLRWSFYDGFLPEQTGGGGRWFPEVTYPRIDAPYNWNTLAPRTGITWKMTEDGRNVAKAAYSRYYEAMYTTEMDAINRNIIISGATTSPPAVYTWLGDLNGNGLVDPGEYNSTPKSVFTPTANSIDPKLKDPRTDEVLLSYQRELATNLSFSAS